MVKKCIYITAIFLLAAMIPARGDVLKLEGGESLSGKVLRIVDHTLVFRGALSGQFMAPMDTVRSLDTDRDLVLTMNGDEVVYGRLKANEGRTYLHPLDGAKARPIELAEIREGVIIPAPPEIKDGGEADDPAWRGGIQAGVQYRGGNRDAGGATARLEIERDGGKADFRGDVLVEHDANAAFPELLRATAALTGDTNRPMEPYTELRVRRDTSASLDLRADMSLGLLWPIGEKGKRNLSALTGINFAYEDWDRARSRQQDTRKDINLHLGLRYARDIFGKSQFREELSLYPSVTDLGDLRFQSNTAMLFPVTTKLRLRLDLNVDYDNTLPFSDIDHWQTAVGAGLQVDF